MYVTFDCMYVTYDCMYVTYDLYVCDLCNDCCISGLDKDQCFPYLYHFLQACYTGP